MKIDNASITRRLDEIRRQVGGKPHEFVPLPPSGRVDMDLDAPAAVEGLFDLSGILIHAGRPVFAYIRDHIWGDFPADPAERKKIHFTVCSTLKDMKRSGRFERYRLTNRDDNRYLVDVRGEFGKTKELNGQILYPCKKCLENVRYHCYTRDRGFMSDSGRAKIVREFDAKEAFRLLWRHFDMFQRQARGLKSATQPTGYAANFRAISRAFRRSRNFTCEQCGVQLSAHQGLVDTHHISGDKSNNRYDNLRCLCKLCHAKQHPHYRVSPQDRRIIASARRYQKISF